MNLEVRPTADDFVSADRVKVFATMFEKELTDRERSLVRLLGQGLDNNKISHKLGLTPGSVRTMFGQMYQKLNIHSAEEIVRLYIAMPEAQTNDPNFPPSELQIKTFGEKFNNLTEVEKQILRYTVAGKTSPKIAGALDIEAGTVKVYQSRLYKKLGVKDSRELTSKYTLWQEWNDRVGHLEEESTLP